ncbi:hypothetical protein QQ045_006229 [Rhodiola kirilowii]
MATWTGEEGRKLFKILNENRTVGNKSVKEWTKIESIYNSQSTDKKTVVQMKNYFHSCQNKYKAWYAMSKMTGIALTEHGLPTAEEIGSERFKAFLAAHPTHGKYVSKNVLSDMDLWAPIFSGKTATGKYSISPALAKAQSKAKGICIDGQEGSGDSDEDVHIYPSDLKSSEDVAWSYSPTKTSSKKRKKTSDDFDRAFEMIKMSETIKSREVTLVEAVASVEEVKLRGDAFIAKCCVYLYEKGLDKLFLALQNDAQKWEVLCNVGR